MSIEEFFYTLQESGVEVQLMGRQLKVHARKGAVDSAVLEKIRSRKPEFIEFLETLKEDAYQIPVIPVNEDGYYEMSHAQQRLWVLDQLEPGQTAYNMPAVYELNGRLDKNAFALAFERLIARHEILRTVFVEVDGEAKQHVLSMEQQRFVFEYTDLRGREDREQYARQLSKAEAGYVFSLADGPLLRARLVQLEDERYLFLFTMHHIIGDGRSIEVLTKEVLELYGDPGNHTAAPAIQYKDYAAWQNKMLGDASIETHRRYWLEQFSGEVPVLDLPGDRPRPRVKTYNGGVVNVVIDEAVTAGLRKLGQREEASLFMLLLSAVHSLLYRYTGQQDIVLGTTLAGRDHNELEDQIGLYVNTLALRNSINGDGSFGSFLRKVKQQTLEAYRHQLYPFDRLVGDLSLARDTGRHPVFDVLVELFNLQTGQPSQANLKGVKVAAYESGANKTKFDLSFRFTEGRENIYARIEYNSDLYDRERIERLACHFIAVLRSVACDPAVKISGINLISPEEQHQLLYAFNDTTATSDKRTVIEQFEAQVAKTPAATAVRVLDTGYSYAYINEQANKLAHYLKIQQGEAVAIMTDRSELQIIGVLGVLKAGGVFVPVEAAYPAERKRYILEDSGARLLLTDSANVLDVDYYSGELLALDLQLASLDISGNNPAVMAGSEDTAYIIYTSGSTGMPKGVAVGHASLSNYLSWANQYYFYNKAEYPFAFFTSLSFDLTITSLFTPLLRGDEVRVFVETDLAEVLKSVFSSGIRAVKLTPSHVLMLAELGLQSTDVAVAILGGEAVTAEHISILKGLNPQMKIYNEYGPTEATVGCVVADVDGTSGLSIGRPIVNTRMYVLDEQLNVQPLGYKGELWIGGDCLSKGYYGKPALTADRFREHPLIKGERIYRTGDVVRYRSNGELEYWGRADEQVKIRGYRIELGEIENALQQIPGVKQAVVTASANRLTGYIVNDKPYFKKEAVTGQLKQRLPDYMIPSVLVEIESIPLTPNGKVDRKQLPQPGIEPLERFIAPQTSTEHALCTIWQELLRMERIGIDDNFFESGGDSIITIQVVSRARKLGYHLQPGDLFDHQTVRALAAMVDSRQATESTAEQGMLSGEAGLLSIQKWFFKSGHEAPDHFNQSVLLKLDKQIGAATLQQAVNALAQQHDALRFQYTLADGRWIQEYTQKLPELKVHALQYPDTITSVCDQYQQSLSITTGDIIRPVLIQTPLSESHNRLFIAIHHLAVDGVSWRILLDDLEQLLTGFTDNSSTDLGQKTSSYREWYQSLEQYSARKEVQETRDYWQRSHNNYKPLSTDIAATGKRYMRGTQDIHVSLDAGNTELLLKGIAPAYHTSVNDILLAALCRTICEWQCTAQVVIGLEGHGREEIAEGIDLSQTAGWFTTMYPVLLHTGDGSISSLIKEVKEQVRAIPGKGLSYGLLQFSAKAWDVLFNYLGQVDNVTAKNRWLLPADESAGTSISGENVQDNALEINSIVADGKLRLRWTYSVSEFYTDTIEELATAYVNNLNDIIAHCAELVKAGSQTCTPSDYGLGGNITCQELDRFTAGIRESGREITSLCRLSGLQSGMLFHGLYEPAGIAYIEQFSCDLLDPDIACFEKSWEEIVKRHSILRTAFFHEAFGIPVQCAFKEARITIKQADFSMLAEDEQQLRVSAYLAADQQEPFDFTQAPLMRIALLRTIGNKYKMVWTHHHILMDGWSVAILMEEFLQTYEQLSTGQPLPVVQEDRYEDYIRYLEKNNTGDAGQYWKDYLAGLETATLLPFVTAGTKDRTRGIGAYQSDWLRLDANMTETIKEYVRLHHITLNTLIQGVWAFLLYKYTGNRDVVYGVTVSGRPEELHGIEQRVGIYINTLPLRVKIDGKQTVISWMHNLQEQQVASRKYQYTPLNEAKKLADISGELFDTLLVFSNYPVSDVVTADQWALKCDRPEVVEHTNYPLTLIVGAGREIAIKFEYSTSVIQPTYIQAIQSHFQQVLQEVLAGREQLDEIAWMTPAERQLVVNKFNDTEANYPSEKTLADLFTGQAARTPDAIAVVFENEELTYRALDERSNRLAHYLQSSGVREESLVGICLERSIEMIVGILGILKSGGAYVPIDPTYPAERIGYMLQDAGCELVINSGAALWDEINTYPGDAVQNSLTAKNAAYVIYTSGSTGKPKGVINEHRGIVNRLLWGQEHFNLKPDDVVLQKTTFCFDISIWELIWPLFTGAKLVFAKPGGHKDTTYLRDVINDQRITTIHFVPSMLEAFLQDMEPGDCSSLQRVLCSGEALKPAHVQLFREKFGTATNLHNLYGPTEAAIEVTCWTAPSTANAVVPIGKPTANTQLYILDHSFQPVPVGVSGELYISGVQVARGYVNRPELTTERFVEMRGERMYRTGDQARWLPDGNIEYLGRIDEQVKIRGYRIEPGEIEHVLQSIAGVKQCVVVPNEKQLVAYLVPSAGFDKARVLQEATKQLPAYMIPSVMVEIESIPLNSNGKIDRKRLPAIPGPDLLQSAYAAPRNEAERVLCTIWEELLGAERVGIHDNFFSLGGDSIITIQVVSRARKAGFRLQPRDLFTHQTIAALAAVLSPATSEQIKAEQGILKGEAGLLPIQQAFFAQQNLTPDHYNQSVLLAMDKRISQPMLQQAINILVQQHDALRFQYTHKDGQWKQIYGHVIPQVMLHELPGSITAICEQYQQSLSLASGRIMQVALITTAERDEYNRLFIAVHHLAIDGVSWRILLEDLEEVLNNIHDLTGPLSLGKKTSSYREWHAALQQYGQAESTLAQLPYWSAAHLAYQPLKTDHPPVEDLRSTDLEDVHGTLNADDTARLLQETASAYNTQINDILLAALCNTICNWQQSQAVVIGLEGHGREEMDGIDLTRAVGWFTTLYPVLLSREPGMQERELVKSIKEQLRYVPARGLGYGALKYLSDSTAKEQLSGRAWDVLFNYLGQVDNVTSQSKWFTATNESQGSATGKSIKAASRLQVNAVIASGKLQLRWTYSPLEYNTVTIEALAQAYNANLCAIISHCASKDVCELTPSDLGLGKEVTYKELDQLFSDFQLAGRVESIYRLSGLQSGMLFHSLYQPGGSLYIEQLSCELRGLNKDAFKKTWEHLISRHTILRSAFYYEQLSIPVQCVFKHAPVTIDEIDYRHLPVPEQQEAIREYLTTDAATPFDLSCPPLMRIALMQRNDDDFTMVWTHHHILMDGWSLGVLMETFLKCYEQSAQGLTVQAESTDHYEDYIRYLQGRDRFKDEAYWKEYLKGITTATLLPFADTAAKERTKGNGVYAIETLLLDQAASQRVKAYTEQHRITINTLVQGIWACLLSHYTGTKDVVYGVTVSGRPEELPDIERRIGNYINTLPLRAGITGNCDITAWFGALQEQQAASRQYQYTSLSEMKQWMNVAGDAFDTLLVFANYPVNKILTGDSSALQVSNVVLSEHTNYPLTLLVTAGEQLEIRFQYNSSLVLSAYARNISRHFSHVLQQVIDGKAESLQNITVITPEEQLLLDGFNATATPYATDKTLIDLFAEQVSGTPNAVAAVYEDQQLTYRELDERTNQLAFYLWSKGVKEESLVGLCLDRSLEMIVGIIGIMKAGGAYVAVDPAYPQERIDYMLQDACCDLVITDNAELWKEVYQQPVTAVENVITPANAAYVIYTSGSTGRPKGVVNEHAGIVNRLLWCQEYFNLTPMDVVLQKTTFCFDVSVWELIWPLLTGAKLVLASPEGHKDPAYLQDIIEKQNVTTIHFVPSMFEVFLHDMEHGACKGLKRILCSGEALKASQVRLFTEKFDSTTTLHNLYGPTEAAIDVSCWTLERSGKAAAVPAVIPIGKPVANTQLYILDQSGAALPIGVAGELYIGGVQVARGYLNREELTAERFVEVSGVRLYRTGDLARWLPDGNIEYLGRIDDQVKVRGYRIELGEVEHVLQQIAGVKQCVAALRERAGEQQIIGYIVPDNTFNSQAVLQQARKLLPAYMVPSVLMSIDTIPLSANGKADRRQLPDPSSTETTGKEYTPPANETQFKLATIWQEVLGLKQAGIYGSFFESGGHSLKALQLVARIQKVFGIRIALRDVFEHTTIAALAEHILQQQPESFDPILRVATQEYYELSHAQKRLWVLQQLQPASAAYNISTAYSIEGVLDTEAFACAFDALVERHEILRTIFVEVDGEPKQKVLSFQEQQFRLQYIDLRGIENNRDQAEMLASAETAHIFSLDKGPLLRAILVRLNEQQHVLLFTIHHIIGDGWSMHMIAKEVLSSYARPDYHPGELRIQYKDYAAWQQSQLQGDKLEAHRAYWMRQLSGHLPVLDLPPYKVRPTVQTFRGEAIQHAFSASLSTSLNRMAQSQDATLFMVVLGLLDVLFYKYTGQQDIILGTSIAGRDHTDLEDQLGFYLNALVLRNQVDPTKNFKDLLTSTRKTVLDAYSHQIYPFDHLVEDLQPERDLSRSTIFDVLVEMQNFNDLTGLKTGAEIPGLSVVPFKQERKTSQQDLNLMFSESEGQLHVTVVFNTDLFEVSDVKKMIGHFEQLAGLVVSGEWRVGDLRLAGENDLGLLEEFNETDAVIGDGTFIDLVEEQVRMRGGETAVKCGSEQITYDELWSGSGNIAGLLLHAGIQKEEVVAVLCDRSTYFAQGVLGIMRAGGVYLPVGVNYPPQRIGLLLRESGAKVLIADRKYVTAELEDLVKVLFSDDTTIAADHTLPAVQGSDLSYIIYTSGSTGKPKGAMVEHRGMLNHLYAKIEELGLNEQSVIAQNASQTFDISIWQLFAALAVGGRTVIYTEEEVLDVAGFMHRLQADAVTVLEVVPSYLSAMLETDVASIASLQQVLVTGETLKGSLVKRWFEQFTIPLINAYGPTEASDDITHFRIEGSLASDLIPIGRPVRNMRIYIVDEGGQLCPVGVKGEIWVSGTGVGRGYVNNEEKTAAVFMEDPFREERGVRLYKTGDIGRYREDGVIEFYGRKDSQVKIRGHRIELGEIESRLSSITGVTLAAVVVREDSRGDKYLAGFVRGEDLQSEALKEMLAQWLPAYMVPSVIEVLDALPLTENGKVDRRSLEQMQLRSTNEAAEYIGPRTGIERELADIWQHILGRERIGITDNFFERGGHSLKAVQIISQVHKTLGVKIELRDVFLNPTIESLATLISSARHEAYEAITPMPIQAQYEVSHAQRRLWILDQLEPGQTAYNMPGAYLFEGPVDLAALRNAFDALISRHEILRTVFAEVNGEPVQRVLPMDEQRFELRYTDLRNDIDRDSTTQQIANYEANQVFSLAKGPLLRANLVQLENKRFVFLFTMHHIIADGWSMNVLTKELLELYEHNQSAAAKPSLTIQYRDYAAWQNKLLRSDKVNAHRNYWLEQFKGELPVLDLPADRERPRVKTYNGGLVSIVIDAETTRALRQFGQQEGTSLFMMLLTAVNALLHRYTGQQDIVLGTTLAGRDHNDLEDQIGFYVNTLAVRNVIDPEETFGSLLQRVKTNTLQAYVHSIYPFDQLVDDLALTRDVSRHPLFDVLVELINLENNIEAPPVLKGVSVSDYAAKFDRTKFDLSFRFREGSEELYGRIEFNTDLYDASRIERLAMHLQTLLQLLTSERATKISALSFMPPIEKQLLSDVLTGPVVQYQPPRTIVQLIESQVKLTPDAIAVSFAGNTFTYRYINEQANRLAHHLRNTHRIRPGNAVAIMTERSELQVIGVLGILKSGGVLVPVESTYPQERKRYILSDSGAPILLTDSANMFEVDYFTGSLLALDLQLPHLDEPRTDPACITSGEDSAYIIYTSGSTGTPKGVEVGYRSLANYLCWANEYYFSDKPPYPVALFTSLSFDLTITSLLAPLMRGDAIHVYGEADISQVLSFIFRTGSGVRAVKLTPSHVMLLGYLEITTTDVISVILGGEAVVKEHVSILKRMNPSMKIYNEYGPTEATVGCVILDVDEDEHSRYAKESVAIGTPMPNSRVYILDDHLNLQPLGCKGEIWIGGDCLSKGYYGKPGLTAERFVEVKTLAGKERLYRTGDIGRYREDGIMEYYGRKDEQVKIRGYRIELGEIESVLQTAPGVKQGIVAVKPDKKGNMYLAGYVVAEHGWESESILQHLRQRLPAYMVPATITEIDTIPLTSNGKADKKQLPDPGIAGPCDKEYIQPQSSTETQLTALWQEALGVERISIHDNFFEIGGDSIITIQVVSRARKLGFNLQPGDLFEYQTIASLAAIVSTRSEKRVVGEQDMLTGKAGLLPIQRWFFEAGHEVLDHYNQTVMLSIDKSITATELQDALGMLVRQHDALRFRYSFTNGEWEQEYANTSVHVEVQDISNAGNRMADAINRICSLRQQELNISTGELVKAIFFTTPSTEPHNRICMIVHHLAIDGVSWRILLEDLDQLLTALKENTATALEEKTSSYRQWHDNLKAYAEHQAVKQLRYWQEAHSGYLPLESGMDFNGKLSRQYLEDVTASMDTKHTKLLLHDVPHVYHTVINDLLLAALCETICNWQQSRRVTIGLEGHGREELMENVDLTRTIGWFTTFYPVVLERNDENIASLIKNTKEQLRRIPDKGVGYAALKYLHPDDAVRARLSGCPWDIVFNYLGQVDNVTSQSRWLSEADEPAGFSINPRNVQESKLEINSIVSGGCLHTTWSFSNLQYDAATIRELANNYVKQLEAIIAHCTEKAVGGTKEFTPADYGLGKEISYQELDSFLNDTDQSETDDIMSF